MAKIGVPGAAVSVTNTRTSIQQVAGVRVLGKSAKVLGELNELTLETPIIRPAYLIDFSVRPIKLKREVVWVWQL
jgi:hypothetical protein